MSTYFHWTFWLLFFSFNVHLSVLCQGSSLPPEGPPVWTHCDLRSRCELRCNTSEGRHWRWLKEGRLMVPGLTWVAHDEGRTLISSAVETGDRGNYTCVVQNDRFDLIEFRTHLTVKTPPGVLSNVSIHASTVIATVRWHVGDDGGYPISHFTLLYKPLLANDNETWSLPVPVHINPAARQFFVYHLKPSTSYHFRLWASNQLGPGEPTDIQATTGGATDPDAAQRLVQMAESEDFSSSAWVIAVSMVMGTVLVLSCLSCILIYKEGRNNLHTDEDEEDLHIITNPGYDLEESRLLEHVDCNCNTEQPLPRLNNNTVVKPSRV